MSLWIRVGAIAHGGHTPTGTERYIGCIYRETYPDIVDSTFLSIFNYNSNQSGSVMKSFMKELKAR